MTRAEHVAWCKQRARQEMSFGGPRDGVMSMISDLRKHPETQDMVNMAFSIAMATGAFDDARAATKFIDGFAE